MIMKKIILSACLIMLVYMAQASSPAHIKVYFNQPVNNSVSTGVNAVYVDDHMADTLIAYINKATISIDIAQYDYIQTYSGDPTISNIATAVNNAYSRGVTVRWIYNGSSSNPGLSSLNSNIHTLASPTTSSYGIMHDKFMIIDAGSTNANVPLVWTGSLDWSPEQCDLDYNNIVVIQDQNLAAAYTAQFNQMWGSTTATPNSSNSKFGPYKTPSTANTFTIDGSTVNLYFSPTDSVNAKIMNTINTATTDMYFGVYTFTENDDAAAIVTQKNNGVAVAGIIDEYSASYSPYTTYFKPDLGSDIIVYNGGSNSIYHNKFLIVNPSNTSADPKVLTGSHNWTASADTKNDENTLIIHNATIANIISHSIKTLLAWEVLCR